MSGEFIGDPLVGTWAGDVNPVPKSPAKPIHAQRTDLRTLYIGAVSLLCNVYRAGDVENDDSVERLARDFNAQGFGLEMARAGGPSGWALFERQSQEGDGAS